MNQELQIYLLYFLLAVLAGVLAYVTFNLVRLKKFFVQFTEGVTKKDLKSLLDNLAKSFKEVGTELSVLKQSVKTIEVDNQSHYQKLGFLRYNPFADTGGDQSFCLCLLDKNNSGIVITSLHSREQTRIYAKAVTKGKPAGYDFAKEEREAVAIAIKKGRTG